MSKLKKARRSFYNTIPCNKSDWLIFSWAAAAVCWQSAGCNYIGPTQTRPAFYWLQLHMRRCDILTEFRVCCSSVRMKQLQFLFSNNRGPEVFWGIMTLIIICHQNDNDHHHHWDETLRTVPVASESIRFYMSTYSAHYTLIPILLLAFLDSFLYLHTIIYLHLHWIAFISISSISI